MEMSCLSSVVYKVRHFVLTAFFRQIIGSCIWSEDTKSRYEVIFLSDSTVAQKERMLLSSASTLVERVFIWLYLRYPFAERQRGYHIDISKYVILHLHSVTGLVDPLFQTQPGIDDRIMNVYRPLRHFIAHDKLTEEDDADIGKTIAIFRLARHYSTVKWITDTIFLGVTRPVNVLSDSHMSMLYYDVLQAKPCSIADNMTKNRILNGEISIIALSYRHSKVDRRHLGLTKSEFIAAARALHAEALPANPPEEYCFWWDSCLRCSRSHQNTSVNWSAIGLAPYAFCHVLSIRRADEAQEARMWIDMERALGRLSRGLTAVDVSDVEQTRSFALAKVIGIGPGLRGDPESALSEGLVYYIAGDLYESIVTFPEDKVSLTRAGLLMACNPFGVGTYRALFDGSKTRMAWVESWHNLEQNCFLSSLLVRLGHEQVYDGSGAAYLDVCVQTHGERFIFSNRRSWLPNSPIYELEARDSDLPYFVSGQTAVLVKNSVAEGHPNVFGLLLYYKEESPYDIEAVHGCVVNLMDPIESLLADSISRLHVPRNSGLLPGFKELYDTCRSAQSQTVFAEHSEAVRGALGWLWDENEMNGDKKDVYYEVA